MDFQYISPFTLIMGIGIFSTLFTLIALTITTNIKCHRKLIEIGVCTSIGSEQNSYYFDGLTTFRDILILKCISFIIFNKISSINIQNLNFPNRKILIKI